MIRRWTFSQALVAITLSWLAIGIGPSAQAQDAGTQEQLSRIERDLSMLQRHVYGSTGGEAPPGAEGGGNLIDLQVRMGRLEQQMRDLTGRVEDETNQVQQLRQRLEQINGDIDVRLGQGQTPSGGPPLRARPSAGTLTGVEPPLYPPPAPMPYGRPPPPPGYPALTPPRPEGEASSYRGAAQLTPPRVASVPSSDSLRPPSDTMPSGSVSAQYNAAYGLLRQADYPAAEQALRNFVRQHPSDPLAGNAQYWLGESYYARGKYSEAAAAFADGYKRYPKGAKAPDELLKLSMSLARGDQKHEACIALAQLDHVSLHPSSAIRDRAAQEKKKLGC